jgi:hypothetical protein
MRSMRIEGNPGEQLDRAYFWLTRAEAAELRDALGEMLAGVDASWHAHVSSADYQREITISLDG